MKLFNRETNVSNHPNAPVAGQAYRISRSKIELFLNCPNCFYFACRWGIQRPASFPYTLNNAVDLLLKKEFDRYRELQAPHPLMTAAGIRAVPFQHPNLRQWRDAFRGGIQVKHAPTHLQVHGLIDDVWMNDQGELIIVDYKATAKNTEVTLDSEWQQAYKRQVEIYQWLFRQNGFKVSNTAYFVYCNANLSLDSFDAKLEFKIKVIPHEGDDSWIERTLGEIRECLDSAKPPQPGKDCDYCAYRSAVPGSVE